MFDFKIKTTLLIIFVFLLFVVSGHAMAGRQGDDYKVFPVSASIKFEQSQKVELSENSTIEINCAKGEAESIQLLISSQIELEDVFVAVTNLKNTNGYELKPEIRIVGYVPIKNPVIGGFDKPGNYPDPLLPNRKFNVVSNKLQSVWITIWTDHDTAEGNYTGDIIVTPQNAEAKKVKLKLKVYYISVPKKGKLKGSFHFWQSLAAKPTAYGENWNRELAEKTWEYMLKYRMTASIDMKSWDMIFSKDQKGRWVADWSDFDEEVKMWMEKGANYFDIAKILPFYGNRHTFDYAIEVSDPNEILRKRDQAAKIRLLNAHLVERGWTENFSFRVFDEPRLGPVENPSEKNLANRKKVRAIAGFISKHAPDIRTMMVACNPAYETLALNRPAYIWSPHFNHYHPDFQRERQKMGEQNWAYQCALNISAQEQNWPDPFRLDREGVTHRALGWWLWRFDCEGYLYWCVNWWKENKFKKPNRGTNSWNGQGYLFYPDPEKKGLPYPSIRAELTREGFEDYELLAILKDKLEKVKSRKVNFQNHSDIISDAEKLLDVKKIIKGVRSFEMDPSVYEDRHKNILEAIDSLNALD